MTDDDISLRAGLRYAAGIASELGLAEVRVALTLAQHTQACGIAGSMVPPPRPTVDLPPPESWAEAQERRALAEILQAFIDEFQGRSEMAIAATLKGCVDVLQPENGSIYLH